MIRRSAPLRRSSKPCARRAAGKGKRTPKRRKKRLSRVRRTSLAAAKRTLWDYFAAYVKARDGNVCFTCDKAGLQGVNWHAGHMIPGRGGWVLFDPEVVRSQCSRCNWHLKGNAPEFAIRYIATFGEAKFNALVVRARGVKQWTLPEVRALIEAIKRGPADYETYYEEHYGIGRTA